MGVFSPLDEELELLPGTLTPSLIEGLVRLGTWLPFMPAAGMLKHFSGVPVSEPTARRTTEQAGAAYVEIQTAEVEALERNLPAAPVGPAIQLLSVDGAMVPLVGGTWAEARTLAIGTVGAPVWEDGQWVVHTGELSYFSRMTDHETFARLATVETHRRGTETAGVVCAVLDGAEWEQKFVDLHRSDAVRILDFPHAGEYVARAGEAAAQAGIELTATWLADQLHEFKHGDAATVLGILRELRDRLAALAADGRPATALEVVATSLGYLEKRREQIRYAEFQAEGYPIGSGTVESANKLVVEARLKGAGMHWAPEHVDPLLALRNIACSDRWEEAWLQISIRLRSRARERRGARRAARQQATAALVAATPAPAIAAQPTASAAPTVIISSEQALGRPQKKPQTPAARRPSANHPWRRMAVGRARCNQAAS